MAEKKVRIFVDRLPGDTDPNVYIGINGKGYLLPKGQYSEVPQCVADAYQRKLMFSRYAQTHATELIESNRKKEKDSEDNAI